jgi:hypothetical protein
VRYERRRVETSVGWGSRHGLAALARLDHQAVDIEVTVE